MEIIITNPEDETEQPFPKLMKSLDTGNIYLMKNRTKGTVVGQSPDSRTTEVGERRDRLGAVGLINFGGSVRLKN